MGGRRRGTWPAASDWPIFGLRVQAFMVPSSVNHSYYLTSTAATLLFQSPLLKYTLFLCSLWSRADIFLFNHHFITPLFLLASTYIVDQVLHLPFHLPRSFIYFPASTLRTISTPTVPNNSILKLKLHATGLPTFRLRQKNQLSFQNE